MSSEIPLELPSIVQESYGIDVGSTITRLSGGLVNETLLVESENQSLVLRKLAPILGAHTIRALHVVGNHLSTNGWEAPVIEPTIDGQLQVMDDTRRIWHAMPNITSDSTVPGQPNPTLAKQVGGLLGGWHQTVSTLKFTPESLPHFHEIDYIAKKLDNDAYSLSDQASQELAAKLLADFYSQTEYIPGKKQIIHGDPKLDNMLFRDEQPFTLIDFDCVMVDSIWTDIGDFLRSLSGKLVSTGKDPSEAFDSFITGYLETTGDKLSFDEARYHALQATRRIACELGMRYLSDIVDKQYYFGWDSDLFGTRAEALYSKAVTQFEILQITRNYLNEGAN